MAKLTQQELESHLWKAADILRGAIDAADYKHYIFGLLFFKRLSDVWQEEFDDRMKEFKDEKLAADPEEHRFHIPKNCFWENIKKKSTNIGEALNSAFRKIEDENLRLKGVFQDVDFNNKERFPDAVLEKLIQHFDKYSLRKKDAPADMLGNAYEYLIAKFADDAGAKGGEFYTPKEVVRLIVECLQPSNNQTVYDPTCGSAGMLLEAFHFMERNKKNAKSLRLFGQEKNLNTWAISQMNLFLHDIDDAVVLRGDTISEPKHLQEGNSKRIKQFDLVIANPPFSLKSWGQEIWKSGDPYGRDIYGCPPKGYADFAFVQHMISSLNPRGRMAVVLPLGVLFREGPEGPIRKQLIESDIIETIIALPPNLFYGADIPTCILIINKIKPEDRKRKIQFVDSSESFVQNVNRNTLGDAQIEKITSAYRNYQEVKGFSKVIGLNEIEVNDFVLNFGLYIQKESKLSNDLPEILAGIVPAVVFKTLRKKITPKTLANIISESEPHRFKNEYLSLSDFRLALCDLPPEQVDLLEDLYIKYGLSVTTLSQNLRKMEDAVALLLNESGGE